MKTTQTKTDDPAGSRQWTTYYHIKFGVNIHHSSCKRHRQGLTTVGFQWDFSQCNPVKNDNSVVTWNCPHTFVVHDRKRRHSLLNENTQRCVERRVWADDRYVLKGSYVQLLQRLSQERRFWHLWDLQTQRRQRRLIAQTESPNELHSGMSCGGDGDRHQRVLQKASGTWESSCVSGCRVCFPSAGRLQAICGSCSSAETTLRRTNCETDETTQLLSKGLLQCTNDRWKKMGG